METIGILIQIEEKKQITTDFCVQEFYMDCSTYEQGTGRKFENILKFQIPNGKVEMGYQIKQGDRIKVHYRIWGRHVVSKTDGNPYHNQHLNAFKIEKL